MLPYRVAIYSGPISMQIFSVEIYYEFLSTIQVVTYGIIFIVFIIFKLNIVNDEVYVLQVGKWLIEDRVAHCLIIESGTVSKSFHYLKLAYISKKRKYANRFLSYPRRGFVTHSIFNLKTVLYIQ